MRISSVHHMMELNRVLKEFLQYKSSPLGIFISLQLKDELAFCENFDGWEMWKQTRGSVLRILASAGLAVILRDALEW